MSDEHHGSERRDEHLTFPEWHNKLPPIIFGVVGPLATAAVIFGVWYYFSPYFTDVGYRPEQPVPYSHKLHVGDLGMDCRYCHTGVEQGPHAGVPPTQTCMNCHSQIWTESPKLLPVRQSWVTGEPVPWVRIHKVPDFAYFDHSVHVSASIGCETCHGRVDQMIEVQQHAPLSMQWCVDCHMEPERNLRPADKVTAMGYAEKLTEDEQLAIGRKIKEEKSISPPIHCSGCHR